MFISRCYAKLSFVSSGCFARLWFGKREENIFEEIRGEDAFDLLLNDFSFSLRENAFWNSVGKLNWLSRSKQYFRAEIKEKKNPTPSRRYFRVKLKIFRKAKSIMIQLRNDIYSRYLYQRLAFLNM